MRHISGVLGEIMADLKVEPPPPTRAREAGEENEMSMMMEAIREENRELRACIGTIRELMRPDLTVENILGQHVERYSREICATSDELTTLRAIKEVVEGAEVSLRNRWELLDPDRVNKNFTVAGPGVPNQARDYPTLLEALQALAEESG